MRKIITTLMILPLFLGGRGYAETPVDSLIKKNLVKEVYIDEIVLQRESRHALQMTTDKVLTHIPGIQVIKRGNFAWEPTIRSLNAGQINITIDGMHIFGACTDRMDPVSSYIEPTNLKRITLNLSPDFDNYGGGIGGGIDFKLKDVKFNEAPSFRGIIGSGFESNSSGYHTLGSLEYQDTRFSMLVNGIFRRANNYKTSGGEEVPFSQYRKWNASLSTGYRLNDAHELYATYIQDEGRDIGYPALTMDVAFANAKIASLTHHYHTDSKLLSHLQTKIYYNFIDHAMDDTKRPKEEVPMHMDMPGQSQTLGFFSETRLLLPAMVDIRLSGYLNRLTADMTMYPDTGTPMYMFTIPDAQRNVLNLDISNTLNVTEKLNVSFNTTLSYLKSSIYSENGRNQLSGILQGQHPDRNHFLWNMHLRGQYAFTDDWHISAHLGRTTRSASLQEYYGFYIFDRLDSYDYLGNHNLSPEKSFNVHVSSAYTNGPLLFEINTFTYLFSDYIAGQVLPDYSIMTIGAQGVKQYRNIGKANLYGGELTLNLQLTDRLILRSANTYSHGSDQDEHALPLISPFVSTNSLSYDVYGYHFKAEMQHFGAQHHISRERYGETPTAAANVFGLGLNKTFSTKRVHLTTDLQLENIFDRSYHRHLDIMKIARPGRNLIARMTIGF